MLCRLASFAKVQQPFRSNIRPVLLLSRDKFSTLDAMSSSSPAAAPAANANGTITPIQIQPASPEEIAARRALARATKPIPCYAVEQIPPKKGGDALYDTLATLVDSGQATLVRQLEIPPRDAKSWIVRAGQLFRILCSHGPQVADMNCWSLHNDKEHFYASKTRQIHATHLSTGDRLWSNMPYIRPLATIVQDTIAYGWDDDGAGVHDVIGSRCDPYTHYIMTGHEFHHSCHSNLTRACVADHLTEQCVHDVLNVFMCTGFTKDTHQYFTKPSPVQVGDYIEFLAETDLRVAASTCPQGDVSLPCGGGGEPVVYPLTVQVYDINQKDLLSQAGWEPSQVNGYSRSHGLLPTPIVEKDEDEEESLKRKRQEN